MKDERKINDILYGELKMIQPDEKDGPRVNVDTILLSHFVRASAKAKIIEMGCAHGAIALILAERRARAFGERALHPIDAFDIDHSLVDLAKQNAKLNGLESRVNFFCSDLREARQNFSVESYDVVVMNPPYDEEHSSRPSPEPARSSAFNGSSSTLEEVCGSAKFLLKNGGRFFLVMRARRLGELSHLLTSINLPPKRIKCVHPRPEKEASSVLVEAVRGGGSGVIVEHPLFICGGDGDYTKELLDAYRIDDGGDCRC